MKRLSPLDNFMQKAAAMAERLRRLTRNLMGSSRVGSNPAHPIIILFTGTSCQFSLYLQKLELYYLVIFKLQNNFLWEH